MTPREVPQRKISIRDVAREAGVSIATASRALNPGVHSGPVRDETRQHIWQVAQALGYRLATASRPAPRQRARQSMTIGCVVPDLTNPFFAELAQSVVEQARINDYQALVCVGAGERGKLCEQQVARELVRHPVDGVVAVPAGEPGTREATMAWQYLLDRGCSVVFMDRNLPELVAGTDSVIVDNREGARKATEYLLTNGHERIGILAGPKTILTHEQRLEGYREAYKAYQRFAGLPEVGPEDAWIQTSSFERDIRENAARALLSYEQAPGKPLTAIMATANQLGDALLAVIHEREKTMPSPPPKVSAVMFDDVDWARLTTPALTTIRHSPWKLGVAAVDLLLRRLQGQGAQTPQHITLRIAELVIRDSVYNEWQRPMSAPRIEAASASASECQEDAGIAGRDDAIDG